MHPSDEELLEEIARVKIMSPCVGVKGAAAELHERRPHWRFNASRVRGLLKRHGLMNCSTDSSNILEPRQNFPRRVRISSSSSTANCRKGKENLGSLDNSDATKSIIATATQLLQKLKPEERIFQVSTPAEEQGASSTGDTNTGGDEAPSPQLAKAQSDFDEEKSERSFLTIHHDGTDKATWESQQPLDATNSVPGKKPVGASSSLLAGGPTQENQLKGKVDEGNEQGEVMMDDGWVIVQQNED